MTQNQNNNLAAERKSMHFYFNWMDVLTDASASDSDIGLTCYYAVRYAQTGELPDADDTDDNVLTAFYFMKSQIDRDTEKYNEMVERNRRKAQGRCKDNKN